MTDPDHDAGYTAALPFWIDTDAYTDRDRAMFVAGFEFAQVAYHLEYDDGPLDRPVHRENESRIRMAAARFRRPAAVGPLAEDESGTWSWLAIPPRD